MVRVCVCTRGTRRVHVSRRGRAEQEVPSPWESPPINNWKQHRKPRNVAKRYRSPTADLYIPFNDGRSFVLVSLHSFHRQNRYIFLRAKFFFPSRISSVLLHSFRITRGASSKFARTRKEGSSIINIFSLRSIKSTKCPIIFVGSFQRFAVFFLKRFQTHSRILRNMK